MKLSRFVGATTRDALRQVREALGEDALIVSNRLVDGNVEIVATLDTPSSLHAQEMARRPSSGASSVQAPDAAAPDYRQPQLPQPPAFAPPAPRLMMRPAMAAAYAAAAAAARQQRPAMLQESDDEQIQAEKSVQPDAGQGAAQESSEPTVARKNAKELPATAPDSTAKTKAKKALQQKPASAADLPHMRQLEPTPRLGVPKPVPKKSRSRSAAKKDTATPASDMARMPDAPMPGAVHPQPAPLDASYQAGMQVQAAINALRGSFESRMDGLLWGGSNGPGAEPVNAMLFRVLLEAGFSMPIVRALIERMPAGCDRQASLTWARNELVTHLPVLRSEDEFLRDGGVYALVGPTGVGKTTTLAKLAARCVARAGREQVAMLTTDMFRIGAVEQLQIYGRLLGVPAHSVSDADELKQALGQLGNRKFILIDTTGISQRHRNVALQAALLTSADRPVRRLLVLNAASQGDTLDEVAHSYRNGAGDDVAGCIITKLDEATRIGSSLDTAIRHRLPIHYVSIGQKVPEDMELADARLLVDRALATPSQSSALYAPSEADMASLLRATGKTRNSDAVRRRQMLANALLPQQAGAEVELEKAMEWLDSDAACAQARANWRQAASGDVLPAPEAIAKAGMELVRGVYSRSCERYVLAVHGKASLKGTDLPSGTLHTTLLMSDRGVALAAPVPQLMLPHGAHAAYAQQNAISDNAADALAARVRILDAEMSGVPQVHLIDAITAGLCHMLSEQGVSWVARGMATSSVMQDYTSTTLSAVAKSLGYVPSGRVSARQFESGEGVFDLWAGGTEIELPVRGQDTQLLRMVSAKLIDAGSGKVAHYLYGLTNVKASQADAGTIARWLLLAEQAKPAFRSMVQAWPILSIPSGAQSLSRQALYACQLGTACWQLLNAPEAASVRHLLHALNGGRKAFATLLPAALLKCYAMLEMAE
ncbi:flagellar biosynthesis protein FlhF [Bordetella sp. FB-8]|uniref:flagellar biosynthesis protein FlhF n=1 Tax=Bordetella sp. FB-8 TaxID=1159870 RepID=UPI00037FAEB5|nr:flagellar biosynthesis protein FlhF [Bordetella sp. FB-8]